MLRESPLGGSWVGSRASVREWIEQFAHCYNHQRPHQILNGKTLVEEVQN
ncbi:MULTISPECIES: integrase core domain-containing protein [Natrialbaceae]